MSVIFLTAAVSAILQGYGGGHRVTDASAELHRLCGCLEQLLQVLPPGPSPPSSAGPDNQEGFPRSLGRATTLPLLLCTASPPSVSRPFLTPNRTHEAVVAAWKVQ